MDNRKINQDVYDRYVDASVALFMEYYCAALSDDIHRKMDQMQAADFAFPESLDIRCKRAIKKEYAIRKRKQFMKSAAKGLRYMAIFAVALLALSSALFISVEAVREPIINYYISLNDEYLEIGQSSNVQSSKPQSINWNDPLVGLVPEGYTLSLLDDKKPGTVTAIYDHEVSGSIFFTFDTIDTIKQIDADHAQEVQEIQIAENNGVLIVKDGIVTIAWGNDTLNKSISITASALTAEDVITIAEQFEQLLTQ